MLSTLSFEVLLLLVSFVQGNGVLQTPLGGYSLGHRILEFQPVQSHRATSDGVVSFQHFSSPGTPTHPIRTRPTIVSRPKSQSRFQAARWSDAPRTAEALAEDWEDVEVLGPDITDLETLSQLARMTADAYAMPGEKNWWDLDEYWGNGTIPVGWDPEDDGFRGHVFTSIDNSTVVLAIKGTTVFSGPTMKKDKLNDNLLFSCCCARVDSSWIFNQVCNCYSGRSRCDNRCLQKALTEDSLFYSVGVNLYYDLTATYPNANVWLVGHSLGGAIAALLSATFGSPSVSFESPGERLAAERPHLPLPPSAKHAITHVYHTADPIPQGACTGPLSMCARGGYALESRCHLGKSIVFDTVNELGWRLEVRKHPIRVMIQDVLGANWTEVPEAVEEDDCFDCYKWEFGNFKERW